MKTIQKKLGFSLIELLVVVGIISVLATVVYANFNESRKAARDDARKVALKEVQLALEMYKAQFGKYPLMGCSPISKTYGEDGIYGSSHLSPNGTTVFCKNNNYIPGLVPDFIAALPVETIFPENWSQGYVYASNGTDYKFSSYGSVEKKFITSYNDEFARCSRGSGSTNCPNGVPSTRVYSVYSPGAWNW
jgi:prepilin-type N-terminal cleavage/methylation domain-containing protein